MASMHDVDYFKRQQVLNREARTRLTTAVTEFGYTPVPSQTNFIMVDVRRDVRDFGAACRAHGVLVGIVVGIGMKLELDWFTWRQQLRRIAKEHANLAERKSK